MSDSGLSSAFDEIDLYLSSLNVGQFLQEIETNGRVIQKFNVVVRTGVKQSNVSVWEIGEAMNEEMTLETFINNAILAANVARRARRRRSASPVRENGAFNLVARVKGPGNVVEELSIEYKPAPGFVYRHR